MPGAEVDLRDVELPLPVDASAARPARGNYVHANVSPPSEVVVEENGAAADVEHAAAATAALADAPLLRQGAITPASTGTSASRATPCSSTTPSAPVSARRPYNPTPRDPLYHKLKYYNRLMVHSKGAPISPPAHVLPPDLFIVHAPPAIRDLLAGTVDSPSADFTAGVDAADADAPGTQTSLTTIFSIWNTMMGSSVLALPWAFAQAGLWGGILVVIGVGAVCCYTAVLVTKRAWRPGGGRFAEFSDMAEYYLGWGGKWASIINSLLILVGAIIVYNVLLEQAFFGSIDTVLYWITAPDDKPEPLAPAPGASMDALSSSVSAAAAAATTTPMWNPVTSSLLLAMVLLPLCSLRDISPLIKFNSMGIPLMLFCIAFILTDTVFLKGLSLARLPAIEPNFFFLAGMLNMAFFIHNVIFSISRNVAKPENVPRDVAIAFTLVGSCYMVVGLAGALAYNNRALGLDSIAQNFLNTYPKTHFFAWLSRTAVFMQLITVFPLLLFITRVQFFECFFRVQNPRLSVIIVFNVVIIGTGTLFCIFYPMVGTVLRYTGALCGFVYMFCLPTVIHWKFQRQVTSNVPVPSMLGHGMILVLGVAILVNQFSIPTKYLLDFAGVAAVVLAVAYAVTRVRRARAKAGGSAEQREPLLSYHVDYQ